MSLAQLSNISSKVIINLGITCLIKCSFRYSVLHAIPDISDGIGTPDLKLTGCLAFCYIVLFGILFKGTETSGKAAYFTGIDLILC